MAGLQQYNFFPTDLLYPRPQPQPSSTNPTVLPLQTPNSQDNTQHQQQHRTSTVKATPSTSSLVFTQKKKKHSLGAVDNKFSSDPLSWLVWMDQDQNQDSESPIP